MKIYKARITQCSGWTYWYRGMVGKEVFTTRHRHSSDSFVFRMVFVGEFDRSTLPNEYSYFSTTDLEIIEEFDGDIVERVKVEVVRKPEMCVEYLEQSK